MPLEPDYFIERRRLKRGLTVWRVVAIVAAIVMVVALSGRFEVAGRDHVARLSVTGIIIDDPDRDEALDDLVRGSHAKALIVRIDSPGGTVVGGEALYHGLRRVAAKMPVVAVMGTEAASAGYMAALGADHIVAHEGTITGSIGVVLQTVEVSELLKDIGISTEAIKSAPLKATPSPFEPLTDETRQAAQNVVSDIFGLFVDLFAERRGLSRDQALRLADGRIYTGRQALRLNLIDALGGEIEARDWLEETHGVKDTLPVREIELDPLESIFGKAMASLKKALFSERLVLDGLISVWHPGVGR